jgi:3-methyladenine DNA glycosylase/8-oxoguanine DNA glycosylase
MLPAPDVTATIRCPAPVDLPRTLGSLRRGGGDPHYARVGAAVVRAVRTPHGPATLSVRPVPSRAAVVAEAWGPGAEWAVAAAPGWVGCDDPLEEFRPEHPLLRDLARRYRGIRVPRTGLVLEVVVPAVLEQKVTGAEAHRSWRELLWRFGEPAPGWPRLRVLPEARTIAGLPSWEWHRMGVEAKRARTVALAASYASRLEECATLPLAAAHARLTALPGIGVWTAAEVAQRALGDADAVSVGDFHLHTVVGYALAGRDVDDEEMVALLEPFRGHRYRVQRLLELGIGRPRFGPRLSVKDIRPH